MNKSARPLIWTQGLFLQPQHFQQFDLYVQSLFYPYSTYILPYLWGICSLKLDEDSLSHRLCEIKAAEVLFPDGTWAQFPGNSLLQPRSLQEVNLEIGKPFTVYLGLRKWRAGERSVMPLKSAGESGNGQIRFVSPIDPEEVSDLHGDGPPARVRFMSLALRIFWETELERLGDYWLVPVAQLEFADGVIKVSRTYTPPTLSVGQSEALVQILKTIRDQITSRGTILEEYKNPSGFQFSENEPHYFLYILALRTLNRYIPVLHQIAGSPVIHPWVLYGIFGQMIGELSSFSDRLNALGVQRNGNALLPEYDHELLHTCFSAAGHVISELLDTLTIGAQNIIYLERDRDFFLGQIPLESLDIKNVFYLVIKATGDPDEIQSTATVAAKLASSDRIGTLISRALPGVPLLQRPVPPPGLPRRPHSYYYKFDQEHDEWHEIRRTGRITYYWTDAPPDTEIQLVILKT